METFDPQTIQMIRETGGDELLGTMINLFLSHTPARIRDIDTRWQAGDLEGIAAAAHALRSSAGAMGASEVYASAAALEKAAREGDGSAVARALPHLAAAFQGACTAIESLRTT